MKSKILLSVLVFGLIVSSFAQHVIISLTFEALHNEQDVTLDRIFIENLTQGGDTTLYAPDNILVLDNYILSIDDYESIGGNAISVSQNYPNPFKEETAINLYVPEDEYIKIDIRDILGRKLAHYENTLNQGNHFFTFYAGSEKQYLLTVSGKQTSKTIKMISANSNTTNRGNCKIIYNRYEENVVGLKSQKVTGNFVWTPGDELRYIGYAKTNEEIDGSDVLTDIPETDYTYIFNITEGVPCEGMPTVTYEGHVYKTVKIGDQCWMKESMNVGAMIAGNEEMTDNGVIEKYCYDNDLEKCNEYGALYNWNEIMQYTTSSGAQGICPDGWHIPSDQDCNDLTYTLGGTNPAGGLMKETGTVHWNSPNIGATNGSGFTARGAGYAEVDAGFNNITLYMYFWNSDEFEINPEKAWYRSLGDNFENIMRSTLDKKWGFSARCLRD